jgi:hypothetical protein
MNASSPANEPALSPFTCQKSCCSIGRINTEREEEEEEEESEAWEKGDEER